VAGVRTACGPHATDRNRLTKTGHLAEPPDGYGFWPNRRTGTASGRTAGQVRLLAEPPDRYGFWPNRRTGTVLDMSTPANRGTSPGQDLPRTPGNLRQRSTESLVKPRPKPEPTRTPGPKRTYTAPGQSTRGLSVDEVLTTEALRGSRVMAGASGLSRAVERINVMEVQGIPSRVRPGALVIATGYPLRGDPDTLADLVTELDERDARGLGVKLGRHVHELPPQLLAEADRRGFPLIRLPDEVAFDDVLGQVLTELLNRQAASLARSEEVHRALVRIVLAGGGLTEIATELVQLLRCAVLITTPNGRVLAEAGESDVLARVYGSACCDATGRLRTESIGTGLGLIPGLVGNRIVVPVVSGQSDHARIATFSLDGHLDGDDMHAVEAAATVAALAVTRQLAVRAMEGKYRADFLRDLITGEVGPVRAVTHSASLGWDVDRPLVVVVAELDVPADERRCPAPPDGGSLPGPARAPIPRPAPEGFAAVWQTVVRSRDPHAPVAGFTREVVAVLGAPPEGDVDRLVRDLVAEVSGDGGVHRSFSTGVSRVAESPEQIAVAYEQARTAVRVGRRTQGPGTVAHFHALGVFRLLSLVEDQARLRAFADEVLGELARTDDDEISDLRHTLQVLLERNLNVAEAARALHFHYNTLRYRIAKLERLLGPFTRDPGLRLSLQLALQVLQMRGACPSPR
jgi:purine catabolism regulator